LDAECTTIDLAHLRLICTQPTTTPFVTLQSNPQEQLTVGELHQLLRHNSSVN
jgi:hypothetical protein